MDFSLNDEQLEFRAVLKRFVDREIFSVALGWMGIAEQKAKFLPELATGAELDGFEVTKDIPKLGYKGTESCEVVLT